MNPRYRPLAATTLIFVIAYAICIFQFPAMWSTRVFGNFLTDNAFLGITAVGMTPHLPIMVIAVIAAVTVMLIAATPLANFIAKNPTIVMLALGFLLMIGTTLIAEGMGFHVPKGYIYAAMAFSALVEVLNMFARRKHVRDREAKKNLH